MINVIKSNLFKLFRSRGYYAICGLLGLSLAMYIYIIYFSPGHERSFIVPVLQNLRANLSNPYIINILFLILVGKFILEDYESGVIKNILGRGIGRNKYFIGNIISVYFVYIITWIIYLVLQSIIYGIKYGIGTGNIGNLMLGIILNLIFMLALLTIVSAAVAITRNEILIILILIITLNIDNIIMLIAEILHRSIDLNWLSMINYINYISRSTSNILFIKGIGISLIYVVIFIFVGIYAINKQDVK